MKMTFKLDNIEIMKNGNVIKVISEENLSSNSSSNPLFSLLELCCDNVDDLEFQLEDNATPFIKKMHEILSDEFIITEGSI